MKRINLLMAAVVSVGICTQSFAQKGKKDNPKHTNYYLDVEEAIETREVVMEFSNAVSRIDMLKFKTKFTNSTNDFLLIDPSKFTVTIEGTGTHPKEKQFILNPNENTSKTIDLKEGANFHVDQIEVDLAGFSRISLDGTPAKMEPFQLPATTNVMEFGNFEVNLKQLTQETKQTWARFEVKYKGNGYAIVDPSRISVKTEGGNQYANMQRKSKSILLEKGESKGIDVIVEIPANVVDMQFAKLFVNWGECMIETKAVPIEMSESVTFELDEALTTEKNK
ncbi:MAG: hypothetical protein KBF73_03770 [Flavobacteriales bacterium]|nr:hypothetical protein [Flavobacteriales bacterium]